MSNKISDSGNDTSPWAFDATFAIYKNLDDAPDSVYIKDDAARSELISSLYASAQTHLYALQKWNKINSSRGYSFSADPRWHIFGIGSPANDLFFFHFSIDLYFDDVREIVSLWDNGNQRNLFQGSRDDARIFLGKMIGTAEADALFLSLLL